MTWWIVIAAALAWTLPGSIASARVDRFCAVTGQRARIHQTGIPHWPIPVEREAFDTFQRGARESDEAAIDEAFAISEWIAVEHGEAVLITAVDGEVVQIELLEGALAGHRAWMKERQLSPAY